METQSVQRKLAAIFAADVAGYSRLMGLDEVGTLRTLTAYRVIVDRLIASPMPPPTRYAARVGSCRGGRLSPAPASGKSPTVIDGIRPRKLGSHQTPRWRERDSNLYGAFPVK